MIKYMIEILIIKYNKIIKYMILIIYDRNIKYMILIIKYNINNKI